MGREREGTLDAFLHARGAALSFGRVLTCFATSLVCVG